MVITFNDLRRIKDKLPSGSTQQIATNLGIEEDTVRNFFGGQHLENGGPAGVHFEKGPGGGMVTLYDKAILDEAMIILNNLKS